MTTRRNVVDVVLRNPPAHGLRQQDNIMTVLFPRLCVYFLWAMLPDANEYLSILPTLLADKDSEIVCLQNCIVSYFLFIHSF